MNNSDDHSPPITIRQAACQLPWKAFKPRWKNFSKKGKALYKLVGNTVHYKITMVIDSGSTRVRL